MNLPRLSLLLASLCVATAPCARALPPNVQAQSFETTYTEKIGYKYLLILPDGYNSDPGKKWPLLIFLHGAGERGNDLNLLFHHGVPKLIAAGKKFDAIVACPQVPEGEDWNPHGVKALVDRLKSQYRVDNSRVYITGLSMGGFGTWATICDYPEVFAAAVPIAGGAGIDVVKFDSLKNFPPVWAFHGDADTMVPLGVANMSESWAKMSKKDTQLTIYPGVGHDSWTQTYENEDMWKWLFSHQKKN